MIVKFYIKKLFSPFLVLAIIPSTKSLGLSQNISCRIHGRKYLVVDTLSFKLMCKICSDENHKNSNLEITNEEISSDEDEDIECDVHPNSKGSFYCDDCHMFLCKHCFSKQHRAHNSNLPEDIALNFKKSLKEYSNSISCMEPKIMQSIQIISDLELKIKTIRESSIKRISDLNDNISRLASSKSEIFFQELIESMGNVDTETNNILIRLMSLTSKIDKLLFEIKEFKTNFKKENDGEAICLAKKEKKYVFIQAKKIFEDNKYLMNYIIVDTIKTAKKKIFEFNSIVDNYYKKLNLYRNSVISSVITGISSYSFKIKRFTKYMKGGIKYFKNSSVVFKSYSAISIVGFNICGLVRSDMKSENQQAGINKTPSANNKIINSLFTPNLNETNLTIIKPNLNDITNTSRLSTKENFLKGFPNERISLPIKISLKETLSDNVMESEVIFEEDFQLTDIVNTIDPTVVFYLKKSINIKPEKLYVISVLNMDNETYLEMWNGEVSKFFQKNQCQNLQCNTTNLKFSFHHPEGIESDNSEFSSGIIADVLYSYKDN